MRRILRIFLILPPSERVNDTRQRFKQAPSDPSNNPSSNPSTVSYIHPIIHPVIDPIIRPEGTTILWHEQKK